MTIMQIAESIKEKILNDNLFSLKMSLFLSEKGLTTKQVTLERQAERNSDKLLHLYCIEFYKMNNLSYLKIADNAQSAKP